MPDLEQRQFSSETRYPPDARTVSERTTVQPEVERRETISEKSLADQRATAAERERRRGARAEEEEKRSMEFVSGGSMLEALAGVAAVVLAIIGLATTPAIALYMMTIATIVVGAGLVLHGSSLAARFTSLMEETAQGASGEIGLGTGVTVEVLAGAAGVVLGILGLIGLLPYILSACAVIAFGAALLLSGGAVTEMNDLVLDRARASGSTRRATRRMTVGAAGLQALTGVGGVVLGIIALTGVFPTILILVGLLTIGSGLLLSGGTVTGRMMTFLGNIS